jgi:hypothetical protein
MASCDVAVGAWTGVGGDCGEGRTVWARGVEVGLKQGELTVVAP